jgi:hypothetical protein
MGKVTILPPPAADDPMFAEGPRSYNPHAGRAMLAGSVSLNTREYVNAHGKEPRGRGTWIFELRGSLRRNDSEFASNPMQKYSEAIADARRLAVSRGATEIVVKP